jgi:hypothetical protein
MRKITPLPWMPSHNTGPSMQGYGQSSCIVGTGENRLKIVAGCFKDIGGEEVAEANAEFIAMACNSHDKLVDGLREAKAQLGVNGDIEAALKAIREALAAVEAKHY